jgi:hypothetical protein
LPFAFASLFRSDNFKRLIGRNMFANVICLFFDSMQNGRGPGPSTSLVTDFFAAVFEDHKVFRRSSEHTDVNGEYEYELNDDMHIDSCETYTCTACTHLMALLLHGQEYDKKSAIPYKCALMSSVFFNVLGLMLRFALLQEIEVPYKLNPQLLGMLLTVQESNMGHLALDASHADNEQYLRLYKREELDTILNVPEKQLSELDVSFVDLDHEIGLSATVLLPYLQTMLDKTTIRCYALWLQCCYAFHTAPFTMLLKQTCGDSIECFERLLCGTVKLPDASVVKECLKQYL